MDGMDSVLGVDLISTGIKTVGMLFVVLALLVSVLYLMKRYLSPRGKVKGDLFIKVVSSLHLSPKERVEVIEILGERVVLGITPGNICFLTKLKNLDEADISKSGDRKDHEINV